MKCIVCSIEFVKGNERQLVCGDCKIMTNRKFKSKFGMTKGEVINGKN